MYYNHNLRTNIQEWKGRLYKASHEQFGHQLKYCLSNIDNSKVLSGLITEACKKHPSDNNELDGVMEQMQYGGFDMNFDDGVHHAAFCYQFIKYIIERNDDRYNLNNLIIFQRGNSNETISRFVDDWMSPVFYYFHDKLEKSSSVIYLLEKYKRRTEWFTGKDLAKKYADATKNFEQLFDDDLRMFLFDQGIDFPFSTPKSVSGRADIVGAIDTDDPIVIEIKVFDKNKTYGKSRIRDGFTQALQYANDYNKDIAYIVIFNMDNSELNFEFAEANKVFPPMLTFNNKAFFFIVINLGKEETASNSARTNGIPISEADIHS